MHRIYYISTLLLKYKNCVIYTHCTLYFGSSNYLDYMEGMSTYVLVYGHRDLKSGKIH